MDYSKSSREKNSKDPGFFSCLQLGRYKGKEIPEDDTPRQMKALALQYVHCSEHTSATTGQPIRIAMGQLPTRTMTPFTVGA